MDGFEFRLPVELGAAKTKMTFKNSSEPKVTIKLTADGGTAKPYDTAKNAGGRVRRRGQGAGDRHGLLFHRRRAEDHHQGAEGERQRDRRRRARGLDQRGQAVEELPLQDLGSSASSCGLFIRSMWRLLGIRHSKHARPAEEGRRHLYLRRHGKSPNHIFTLAQDAVLENGKITTVSIDGGQSRSAQDAPSLGIWPRKRHLNRDTLIFDEDPDGNKRKVASWVSFEKLLPLFKAKMIRLKRTDTITDDMKNPRGSGAA